MKKLIRIIKYIFFVFLSAMLIYLLVAFVLSAIPVYGKDDGNEKDVDIYIMTNGVHTDIAIPVKTEMINWSSIFRYENTFGKDSLQNYIGIGWGNKDFYINVPQWSDITFKVTFSSMFGLGDSALHITYYKSLSESDSCIKISISKDQYKTLIRYISKSIKQDNNHNPILIDINSSYGTDDSFYMANGRYSLLNTCNTWANNALKASEQKAALWTPFQKGIFFHYK